MTVLITEDDIYSAILIKEYLQEFNFKIHHVITGKQAILFCKNNDVDLVLMDIRLPDISGFDAIAQIKKLKPALPVIAQTASITETEVNEIKKACFDNYIFKPYNKKDFRNIVIESLNNKTYKAIDSKKKSLTNQLNNIPLKLSIPAKTLTPQVSNFSLV